MRGAAALALLLLPGIALAQERVRVRTGDHPGHGRIVADWAAPVPYQVDEAPGRAVLRFGQPALFDLSGARRLPRNVAAISASDVAVEVALRPGARLRHYRLGNRVVLDVLDPAPRRAPAAPAQAPAAAPPALPAAAPVPAPPEPSPRLPAVTLLAGSPPALAIPAAAGVGAALLRRGDQWLAVFDAALVLDLSALRGVPALAAAALDTGLDQAVLRVPAAIGPAPRLRREGAAWILDQPEGPAPQRAILAEPEPGAAPRLLLRAARPSRSVAVADPETGGTLLVGTVLEEGQGVPLLRSLPQLSLLPTRLGVAVLPRADTIGLRPFADRFAVLSAPGATLSIGPAAAGDAEREAMSRIFDLPPEPVPALQERVRAAMADAAAAPPLARGPARLAAAQALIALGLPQEAQAMADLALREDPLLAADPRARAVHGAAALLAGRVAEARGLEDDGPASTNELALWRGLLASARGEGGQGAIAAAIPLLLGYPAPLRARLLPMAAEALAGGGEAAAARRLMAGREADTTLDLARAMVLEAEGATEAALPAYDALAAGRDRRARVLALRRAVELRLAAGQIDASAAAAALQRALPAWRGDSAEAGLRLRLAGLHRQAGAPRAAFDLLRETEPLFPDLAARLREEGGAALAEAIATEPPLTAVALFDAHADLLPRGAESDEAVAALADRLAALDLTERATVVLARAAARAATPEIRARLGARQAALSLESGNPRGARDALVATAASGLPAPLAEERTLLEARALAGMGESAAAAARFRAAGPAGASELAELLGAGRDWAGAAAALRQVVERGVPAAPAPLDPAARRLLARLAAFHVLAGEEAALAALRAAHGERMAGGPLAEAFGLLTSGRLEGISALPRLSQELELARLLPARLEVLRTAPLAAR